jgi:ribonuclease P protein component
VGYVIGRRSIPLAVDRNRLRRRLREVVRAARPALCEFDVIVRVRASVPRGEIQDAVAEAAALMRRLTGVTPSGSAP